MVKILKGILIKTLLLLPGVLLLGFVVLAFLRIPIAESLLTRQLAKAGIQAHFTINEWRWGHIFIEDILLQADGWEAYLEGITVLHDRSLLTQRKIQSLSVESLRAQFSAEESEEEILWDFPQLHKNSLLFEDLPANEIILNHFKATLPVQGEMESLEGFFYFRQRKEEKNIQAKLTKADLTLRLMANSDGRRWWGKASTNLPFLRVNHEKTSIGNSELASPHLFSSFGETFDEYSLNTGPIDLHAELLWPLHKEPQIQLNAWIDSLQIEEIRGDSRLKAERLQAELRNPLAFFASPDTPQAWQSLIHTDRAELTSILGEISLEGISVLLDENFNLLNNWGRISARSGEWTINTNRLPVNHNPLPPPNGNEGENDFSLPALIEDILWQYPLEFALRNQTIQGDGDMELPKLVFHSERYRDSSGFFPFALRLVDPSTLDQVDIILTKTLQSLAEIKLRANMDLEGFGKQKLPLLPVIPDDQISELSGSVETTIVARWDNTLPYTGSWEKNLRAEEFNVKIAEHGMTYGLDSFAITMTGNLPDDLNSGWAEWLPQYTVAELYGLKANHPLAKLMIPEGKLSLEPAKKDFPKYSALLSLDRPQIEFGTNQWRDFLSEQEDTHIQNLEEEAVIIPEPFVFLSKIPLLEEVALEVNEGAITLKHWYEQKFTLPWEAKGNFALDEGSLQLWSRTDSSFLFFEYSGMGNTHSKIHLEGEIKEQQISSFWRNVIEDITGLQTEGTVNEFVFAGNLHPFGKGESNEFGLVLSLDDFAIPEWDVRGNKIELSALWENLWEGYMRKVGQPRGDRQSFPLKVSIEEIMLADLSFKNTEIEAIMKNWQDLRVEKGVTAWNSASLSVSPFSLNPAAPEGIIQVHFRGVPIRDLLELFPKLQTTGEGNLEGMVSFFLSPTEFRLLPGTLSLPQGETANLQIRQPGLFTANLSPNHPRYQVLRRAETGMQNLLVDEFLVQLFRPEEPDTPIRLRIRTQALDEDILPFDLNFHIHGAIEEIIPLLLRTDIRFRF